MSTPRGAIETFVVQPPFWLTWWFLVPTTLGTVGIGVAGGFAVQRNRRLRHAQSQLVGELQRELHVAQQLQAGLLPQSDPVVPGLEVTGFCRPASEVGGGLLHLSLDGRWHEEDGHRGRRRDGGTQCRRRSLQCSSAACSRRRRVRRQTPRKSCESSTNRSRCAPAPIPSYVARSPCSISRHGCSGLPMRVVSIRSTTGTGRTETLVVEGDRLPLGVGFRREVC